MKLGVLILAGMLLSSTAFAQKPTSNAIIFRDTRSYIDTLERLGKLKIEDQIEAWQTFLADHPQHTFRAEIEKNVERLELLSTDKPAQGQGDKKDAEIYLKALEFSKKLKPADQILLWQQFLDENPTNIYRNDAQTRLYKLKRTQPRPPTSAPAGTVTPPNPTPPPITVKPKISLSGPKPLKDPDRALLYAWLPGLVVPSMGHWYTQDYLIAGLLTAIRLAGIVTATIGIVNEENEKIYLGVGMALVSYGIDIGDAPYSARRFNESHQQTFLDLEKVPGRTIPIYSYALHF